MASRVPLAGVNARTASLRCHHGPHPGNDRTVSAVTSVVVWTAGGLLIGLLSPPPLLRLGMRRGVDAGVFLLITWANLVSLTVIAIALPAVSADTWLLASLGVEMRGGSASSWDCSVVPPSLSP